MLSRILAVAAIGTALLSSAFVSNAHALDMRKTTCTSLASNEQIVLYIDKDSQAASIAIVNSDTGTSRVMPAQYAYKPKVGVLVTDLNNVIYVAVPDVTGVTYGRLITGTRFPVLCEKFKRL